MIYSQNTLSYYDNIFIVRVYQKSLDNNANIQTVYAMMQNKTDTGFKI